MEVEPKLRDLKYCLLREMVVYKEHQGTCSAVIYGLNAVGRAPSHTRCGTSEPS